MTIDGSFGPETVLTFSAANLPENTKIQMRSMSYFSTPPAKSTLIAAVICCAIFKPFRVIKGQVFCSQWTGNKRLNITV